MAHWSRSTCVSFPLRFCQAISAMHAAPCTASTAIPAVRFAPALSSPLRPTNCSSCLPSALLRPSRKLRASPRPSTMRCSPASRPCCWRCYGSWAWFAGGAEVGWASTIQSSQATCEHCGLGCPRARCCLPPPQPLPSCPPWLQLLGQGFALGLIPLVVDSVWAIFWLACAAVLSKDLSDLNNVRCSNAWAMQPLLRATRLTDCLHEPLLSPPNLSLAVRLLPAVDAARLVTT